MRTILLLALCTLSFLLNAQISLVQELNPGISNTSCYCDFTYTNNQDCTVRLDENISLIKLKTIDTNWELFKITDLGIELVMDIAPGDGDSDIQQMIYFEGKVYFIANDGNGHRIWETDGSSAGTNVAFDLGDENTSLYDINGFIIGEDGRLYFEFDKTIYTYDGSELSPHSHSGDIKIPENGNQNSKAWCKYEDGIAIMNHNGSNWELIHASQGGITVISTLDLSNDSNDPYGMAEFDGGLIFSFGHSPRDGIEGLYVYSQANGEVTKVNEKQAQRVKAINTKSCLVSVNSEYYLFNAANPSGKKIGDGRLGLTLGDDWTTATQGSNILFHSVTGSFNDDVYSFYNAETETTTEIYRAARESFPLVQIGSYGIFAANKDGSFSEFAMYAVNLFTGDIEQVADFGDPEPFNLFYKAITIINGDLYFFGSIDSDLGIEIYKTRFDLNTSVKVITHNENLQFQRLSENQYQISCPTNEDIELGIVDLGGRSILIENTRTNVAFSLPENGLYFISVNSKVGTNVFKAFSN